jgi:hypothetical protein
MSPHNFLWNAIKKQAGYLFDKISHLLLFKRIYSLALFISSTIEEAKPEWIVSIE